MRALALIAGLVAVVASAGTIDPGIADARYREYGETFSTYTCRLLGTNTDDELQVGTCTIVAPHWALTAAHVVADMTECYVVSAPSRTGSTGCLPTPAGAGRLPSTTSPWCMSAGRSP
jgi:hypothetical protein